MSEWIAAVPRIPSTQYIKCMKTRTAALPCRLRSSRWNPQVPTRCDDGCQSLESLSHVIKKYPGTDTHDMKHKRYEKTGTRTESKRLHNKNGAPYP